MSMRRVLLPWDRQPQESVGAADGLRLRSLLLGSTGRTILGRGGVSGLGPTVASPQGLALTLPLPFEASVTVASDSAQVLPTGPVTIIIVKTRISTTFSGSAVLVVPFTDSRDFNFYGPYSDGNAYFRWGGETNGAESVSGSMPGGNTAAGGTGTFLLSSGGDGMQIWKDGTLVASNSANPTRTDASGTPLTVGVTDHPDDVFQMLAFIEGQLSREQNRALSANPWLIFEPQTIWVPVASAAVLGFKSRYYYDMIGRPNV